MVFVLLANKYICVTLYYMKTKSYTFRATEREAKAIDAYCDKEDLTVSDAIRQLIAEKLAYYMIDIEETKKEKRGQGSDFTNEQIFKVGEKVEFYITNPEDRFFGIHTVKKTFKHPDGTYGIQTDIIQKVAEPKNLFIHVHWFKPVKK